MKTISTLLLLLTFSSLSSYGQLSIGDIALIGYNTDAGPGASEDHSFSFISLTDIPGGEIIYFTEEGWNNDVNDWAGNTEGHIKWTAPAAGTPCGTVIYITESGTDVFTVTGGGTAILASGVNWNLSGGDQVLAYQSAIPEPGTPPTFIAGLNGDDGGPFPLDPVTHWNDPSAGALGTAGSGLPYGLTNGVNCVALFISALSEVDNAKYSGTLTGTSAALRASINDRTNWSFDEGTAFDISPGAYSPSVTCDPPCTSPTVPTLTYGPLSLCEGETATINISGTFNDATAWHIYTGSCGGTEIGSTAGSSFDVTPVDLTTVYYVRGEGACVVPGACASITIESTPADDASFNYGLGGFCPNGIDPTPEIFMAGGTFTSDPAGLVIDVATGTVDLSASIIGTYSITYTTSGDCPAELTEYITIDDADPPVPDLGVLPVISTECEVAILSPPSATDDCGGFVTVTNDASLPINMQGTTTVTWTFTDEFGNASTQTQDIIIDDITNPIPDEIPLPDYVSACQINELPTPSASDNCSGDVSVTSDAVFPITAPTTVTWTYDDGNGNMTTQTQNIEFAPMDVNTTITDAITINANNGDADAYQWINCDENSIIAGANESIFTPGANGAYAVIITEGECVDTSECVLINQVNLTEELSQFIHFYPNPTSGEFIIIQTTIEIEQLTIIDLNGRVLLTENNLTNGIINISTLSAGAYIIVFKTASDQFIQKRLEILN